MLMRQDAQESGDNCLGELACFFRAKRAGLWLSSFQVFRIGLNGYETALAAVVLLGATALYLSIWQNQPRGPRGAGADLALGTLFGLGVLTRVDLGFLAVCAALWFLWRAPEVKLMLIEPRGVPNTGDQGGSRTAEGNVGI